VLTILASEPDRTTYLAEQEEIRRLVTLDVVRVGRAPGGEDPAWLGDRVRALTQWAHPGVPRVIDGRHTPSGDFCVVAQYVTGPALDRYCETHRLDGQSRARLFAQVCEAVSDGHRHGVCHGRLRPDLVIAAETGDAVVPLIFGYSIVSDRVPTVEDDLSGLEDLARAMGWQGPSERSWRSVDGLLAATSADWPVAVVAGLNERTRG
jgi:serine/threonine protein kinase